MTFCYCCCRRIYINNLTGELGICNIHPNRLFKRECLTAQAKKEDPYVDHVPYPS